MLPNYFKNECFECSLKKLKSYLSTFTLSIFAFVVVAVVAVVATVVVVVVVGRTFTVKVHPTSNKHFKLTNNGKEIEKRGN